MAGDAASVAANVYKVLLENDRVRLLEARLKPGDSSALHSRPGYLVYNLEDGKVKSAVRAARARKSNSKQATSCGAKPKSTPPRASAQATFTHSSSS